MDHLIKIDGEMDATVFRKRKIGYYKQKYSAKWEEEPELEGWLQAMPNNNSRARCRYCKCTLTAKLKVLKEHALSRKHREIVSESPDIQVEDGIINGDDFPGNIKLQTVLSKPIDGNEFFEVDEIISDPGAMRLPPSEYPKGPLTHREKVLKSITQCSKAIIGKPAPSWDTTALLDGQFKHLRLSDYRGKYLVLFFYPMDFSSLCPTEILAFDGRLEEFLSINCEIVACSVDSEYAHLAWTKIPPAEGGLGEIGIPLLTDTTHNISRQYGVFVEEEGYSLRGLFIIDPKSILRHCSMTDVRIGRNVDEVLRLVQALQCADENNVVCPAGWRPGGQVISPSLDDSRRLLQKGKKRNKKVKINVSIKPDDETVMPVFIESHAYQ